MKKFAESCDDLFAVKYDYALTDEMFQNNEQAYKLLENICCCCLKSQTESVPNYNEFESGIASKVQNLHSVEHCQDPLVKDTTISRRGNHCRSDSGSSIGHPHENLSRSKGIHCSKSLEKQSCFQEATEAQFHNQIPFEKHSYSTKENSQKLVREDANFAEGRQSHCNSGNQSNSKQKPTVRKSLTKAPLRTFYPGGFNMAEADEMLSFHMGANEEQRSSKSPKQDSARSVLYENNDECARMPKQGLQRSTISPKRDCTESDVFESNAGCTRIGSSQKQQRRSMSPKRDRTESAVFESNAGYTRMGSSQKGQRRNMSPKRDRTESVAFESNAGYTRMGSSQKGQTSMSPKRDCTESDVFESNAGYTRMGSSQKGQRRHMSPKRDFAESVRFESNNRTTRTPQKPQRSSMSPNRHSARSVLFENNDGSTRKGSSQKEISSEEKRREYSSSVCMSTVSPLTISPNDSAKNSGLKDSSLKFFRVKKLIECSVSEHSDLGERSEQCGKITSTPQKHESGPATCSLNTREDEFKNSSSREEKNSAQEHVLPEFGKGISSVQSERHMSRTSHEYSRNKMDNVKMDKTNSEGCTKTCVKPNEKNFTRPRKAVESNKLFAEKNFTEVCNSPSNAENSASRKDRILCDKSELWNQSGKQNASFSRGTNRNNYQSSTNVENTYSKTHDRNSFGNSKWKSLSAKKGKPPFERDGQKALDSQSKNIHPRRYGTSEENKPNHSSAKQKEGFSEEHDRKASLSKAEKTDSKEFRTSFEGNQTKHPYPRQKEDFSEEVGKNASFSKAKKTDSRRFRTSFEGKKWKYPSPKQQEKFPKEHGIKASSSQAEKTDTRGHETSLEENKLENLSLGENEISEESFINASLSRTEEVDTREYETSFGESKLENRSPEGKEEFSEEHGIKASSSRAEKTDMRGHETSLEESNLENLSLGENEEFSEENSMKASLARAEEVDTRGCETSFEGSKLENHSTEGKGVFSEESVMNASPSRTEEVDTRGFETSLEESKLENPSLWGKKEISEESCMNASLSRTEEVDTRGCETSLEESKLENHSSTGNEEYSEESVMKATPSVMEEVDKIRYETSFENKSENLSTEKERISEKNNRAASTLDKSEDLSSEERIISSHVDSSQNVKSEECNDLCNSSAKIVDIGSDDSKLRSISFSKKKQSDEDPQSVQSEPCREVLRPQMQKRISRSTFSDSSVDEDIAERRKNYKKRSKVLESLNEGNDMSIAEVTIYEHATNEFKSFISGEENVRSLIQEQLQSMALVHGAGSDFQHIEFGSIGLTQSIYDALEHMKIHRLMRIQKFAWPLIMQQRNMVMISPQKTGKTLAYAVPLIHFMIMHKINGDIPKGNGPVLLILCSGCSKIANVEKTIQNLLEHPIDIKILSTYGGDGRSQLQLDLMNGCDILITTPLHFMKILGFGKPFITFNRLKYFVLDEIDVLTMKFLHEVKNICEKISEALRQRDRLVNGMQLVVSGEKWCPGVEMITERLPAPVICITSFLEASVYSKIKPKIHLVDDSDKLHTIIDLLQGKKYHLTVIVCKTSDEVRLLEKEVKRVKLEAVFTLHDDMTSCEVHDVFKLWNSSLKSHIILICTDMLLQDLRVKEAMCLIHFSLPENKTQFGYRFSCLMNNLPNRFKKNAEKESHAFPVVHVFIDKSDKLELPGLCQFFRRLNIPISAGLEARSKCALKQKEEQKRNFPLCLNMKLFGECWRKADCMFRHVVCDRDKPRDVPMSGKVKIKIFFQIGVCQFVGRILHHIDADGKVERIPNRQMEIVMKLARLFKDEDKRAIVASPELDGIYAYESAEGVFQRAQIIADLHTDRHGVPQTAYVKLIDHGATDIVKVYKLYEIPQELKDIPAQTVEFFLCGLSPHDKDWNWGRTACHRVRQILCEASKESMYLIGKIKASLGSTIWLDPLECHQELLTLKTTALVFSLRSKLLEEDLAVENPLHLELLWKAFEEGGITIPSECEEEDVPRKTEPTKKETINPQWAFLSTENFVSVYFITAENPGRFFMQQTKFDDLLQKLNDKIQKLPESAGNSKDILSVGDYCIGKFPSDKNWYRGRVESVEGENLVLYFVDHGDTASVPRSEVYRAPVWVFSQLPFQAIECELAGVSPDSGDHWSEKATDTLYDLASFNEVLQSPKLCVKVIEKRPGSRQGGGYKYSVLLVDVSQNEKIVLNEVMVEKGVALQHDDLQSILEHTNLSEINVNEIEGYDADTESQNEGDEEESEVEDIGKDGEGGEDAPESIEDRGVTGLVRDDMNFNFEDVSDDEYRNFVQYLQNAGILTKPEENGYKQALVCAPSESVNLPIEEGNSSQPHIEGGVNSSDVENNNTNEGMPLLIKTVRHPSVLWRQNAHNIYIDVELTGVVDFYLDGDIMELEFWTTLNDVTYGFKMNLFGAVDPQKIRYAEGGLTFRIKLYKLHHGTVWPRLLKEEEKMNWLKYGVSMEEEKDFEEFLIDSRDKARREPLENPNKEAVVDFSSEEEDETIDDHPLFPPDHEFDPYDPLD